MIFLSKSDVLAIHERAIAEFGGAYGLRDDGALESAVLAAQNRYFYEQADLVVCAATYAYHLCKAHAFIDGNKRVAGATMEVFIVINNAELTIDNDQFVAFIVGIADNSISRDVAEVMLDSWIRPLAS